MQAILTHGLSIAVAQMDFAVSGFRDKLYGGERHCGVERESWDENALGNILPALHK